MMDLEESLEEAGQLAEAAIASMARLGVAPTPTNFLIWYSRCSGRHPELAEEVLGLESSGAAFTGSRCAELHERYFGPSRQVRLLNATCEKIESTMAALLAEVDGMSGDAGAYGGKLRDLSANLQRVEGKQALHGLVGHILDETRKMLVRAQHLESELNQSSEQMTALRADLASAHLKLNTDDLTGIANRRCFDQELQEAAEQGQDKREPMCLLMADIDHFKTFNDNYGHPAGDQILKLVAQVLTSCVKGRDVVARYGGEEFAVILPHTGLDGGRALAEQICRAVAATRVRVKSTGRELGSITLSVGCAQHQWGERPVDLVQRADTALYRAKQLGRNRVAVTSRLSAAFAESSARSG
jgi:diguanylate cyclase